jgi:hypothetical protein
MEPNEELRNLYSSSRIDRIIKSRRMGLLLLLSLLLIGKQVGKRPLGRPRRRWVDSIKIVLVEIGWGGAD